MVVEFVKGETQDYVAQIDFGLNFDDRNIKSLKVKKGRVVSYDGEIASYLDDKGETILGRCTSLKSAINALHWLVPRPVELDDEVESSAEDTLFDNEQEPTTPQSQASPKHVSAPNDYDDFKGGSFDTALVKSDEFVIADNLKHAADKKRREIIKEEDLIVKTLPNLKKTKEKPKSERLEIALDQNAVKKVGERTIVSSSTVVNKEKKRNPKVIQSDEMGADHTQPLKRIGKTATEEPKKKDSFIVDNTTPLTVNEDMTLDEVRRVTKVIQVDESQDAQVVTKIDRSKIKVKEIDGITLKKPKPQSHDIKLSKVKTPSDMTITTTVGAPGSGGGEVFDATEDGVEVVAKVGEKSSPKKDVTASQIVEDMIAPQTEETEGTVEAPIDVDDLLSDAMITPVTDVPEEKAITEEETVETSRESSKRKAQKKATERKKAASKTQAAMEAEKTETVEPEEKTTEPSSPEKINYLSILPEDWGKLHWVKKEKFVKKLTDIDFIKYLLTVENTKAIQRACKERLKALGEEISD